MLEVKAYSYAVVRVVPRVDREEFLNAGVVLFSQEFRFLGARVFLDRLLLMRLHEDADPNTLQRHLEAVVKISDGDIDAGPIARLSQKDRFHWLTAPRSTTVQISPIRTGLTSDPEHTLEHLLGELVLR